MKSSVRSLIAGALWGALLVVLLGPIGHGSPSYIPVGVLVTGPLIGLSVYGVSKWTYDSISSIAVWTVPSVYFAAAINGLVVGMLDSIKRGSEMIYETFAFALYGITVPSPWWLLFPLAFITHLWVRAGNPNHSPEPTH
jgi:hypothetical protein